MHTVADQIYLPRTDLTDALKHKLVESRISDSATDKPFKPLCPECHIPKYGHLPYCPYLPIVRKAEEVMSRMDQLDGTQQEKNLNKQAFIISLEDLVDQNRVEGMVDHINDALMSGQFEEMMADTEE